MMLISVMTWLCLILLSDYSSTFPINDHNLRLIDDGGRNLEERSTRKVESFSTPANVFNKTGEMNIRLIKNIEGVKFRQCAHKYSAVARTPRTTVDDKKASSYDEEYEEYDNQEPILSNVIVAGIGEIEAELCATDSCYAFWTEINGEIVIQGQGCWESSNQQKSCSADACTSDASSPRKFCCCNTDFCNVKPVSILPIESSVSKPSLMDPHFINPVSGLSRENKEQSIGIAVAAACSALIVLVVIASLVCRIKFRSIKTPTQDGSESGNLNAEAGGPGFSSSNTCVDNLKLHDNIGSGRYAKVWRGSLGGVPVAVKALPATNSSIWTRERDLYCLPHMNHANLLTYIGCDTRPTLDGEVEHLLILQLAPLGSLRNYLTEHTLDWDTFTKMALGLASALAHLHTHIQKQDQYKPCIVHRDVNSSNVVVRADLSCCLADLGLAMPLPDPSKKPPVTNQHMRIQEAGTLRYLSPEALEGALDLRRCDAALRAVDVYAMALVIWELLSRCSSLHRSPGPSEYAPPFFAEVGEHPTLEQMQVIVARKKARPLFSPLLLNSRGAKLARDTCEDCWDHDAEARLTAVCVVERLNELRNLKPAPSPTINSNDLRPSSNGDVITNWHSPGGNDDKNSNFTNQLTANHNGGVIFDFYNAVQQPLQPHQGRNPCLERNLASAEPCDHLIDKSFKDMPSNSSTSSTTNGTSVNGYGTNNYLRMENSSSTSNLRNQPQDFSRPEEVLVNVGPSRNSSRVFSNQADQEDAEFRQLVRPVTPIDYVQNDVSESNGPLVNGSKSHHGYPPKKTNMKADVSQKWSARYLKRLIDTKVFGKKSDIRSAPLDTEVNLVLANGKPINNNNINTTRIKTSVITNDNKVNQDEFRLGFSVDRPNTLPGLDAIVTKESAVSNPNCLDGWKSQKVFNDTSTCTMSPPNQTVSTSNLVVGYKELPNFVNEPSGSKSSAQVFAVIVPKITTNKAQENKRLSCDEQMVSENSDNQQKITSNFCIYNEDHKPVETEENFVDYSSNSEDEHMLLLSENGGSKITMRQRLDVRPSADSKIRRKSRNLSISSMQEVNGLSKMASESFSSLCNKYGPKGKYENLKDDDNTFRKKAAITKKDVSLIGSKSGSNLSLCRQSIDDTSFMKEEPKNNEDDSSSTEDDDDNTLKDEDDEVFTKTAAPRPLSIRQNLSRQHSLEIVSELFSSSADLTRLKDPASRIKTPGDVPPSVRRMRGNLSKTMKAPKRAVNNNRLSLYDDRIMFGNTL